ncbi:MAG: c-type cytochrome [Verrucomicrobiales bacterium]|nr:c-type cytochrome [Verrucomicrobiales bacterium]
MAGIWILTLAWGLVTGSIWGQDKASHETPQSSDPAITLTKFAGSDLIKHPTGITLTKSGKLLAVESHTHFAPKNYQGPKTDRIWWIEDSDGDGTADKRTLFFKADLVATMDIATHPETGAIYVATRNEVLRLWDKDGDGTADPDAVKRRLVFLDTKGTYPHDGCSGLTFDGEGNLIFGIGENLGFAYTLRGSDGTAISDEGEGGNIWTCDRDGKKLRRWATGFWNPFGVVYAPGGHVFATDNDPSSRPPSRLHYVIDGGDYGYQFRYGRSGHHPFVSWNGETTGTLPMLHSAGEAPCDVIFKDGHLLVASWADHRLEHYPLTWNGTHFETEQKILVQGGVDFRPVAFAEAEDGATYISDWVKREYELHDEGAIWKMTGWKPKPRKIPPSPDFGRKGFPSWRQASTSEDPWTVSRAIRDLQHVIDEWPKSGKIETPQQKKMWALANRAKHPNDPRGLVLDLLAMENDPEAQLLGLKWIADLKLKKYRAEAEKIANDPPSPVLFHAAATALARLDGQKVDDRAMQRFIGARLANERTSAKVKRAAFHVLADREKILNVKELRQLMVDADEDFQIDVMLTLLRHPDSKSAARVGRNISTNPKFADRVRYFALDVARRDPSVEFAPPKPTPGPLDNGRRVFHRSCANCHRALGFGKSGGPDLSTIGERGREHIEKSILDPSAEIAPQYEPWKLTLEDGTEKIGFLLSQKGGNHFYADIEGKEFKINNRTIVTREQVPVSLMPPALNLTMPEQDFRDLVDWLSSLK